MTAKTKILIADDDADFRKIVARTLGKAGYETIEAENGKAAAEKLSDDIPVAVLDLRMPEMDGMECLRWVQKTFPDTQVIMLTANNRIEDAVKAMKAGAFEYLTKPMNGDELVALVRQAEKSSRLGRENRQLRQAISGVASSDISFVAEAPLTKQLLEKASKVSSLDSTVMITGESGVGKGLLARWIHAASPRSANAFVTVNATALPRDLVESELFGHEKGAFTGAIERRTGRVEVAHEGTLFLDEVGDMPMELQPKLLTFLQERTYARVGAEREISADVRVIAATHRDLKRACEEKTFREDLYFRLNVLPLHIAPLRERTEDIPILAERFLSRIAAHRKCEPFVLTPQARATLLPYAWPGNVRELENVLERASAFCEGPTIRAEDLPPELTAPPAKAAPPSTGAAPSLADRPLAEIERDAIEQTLASCGGNKAAAARRLGISEKSIYNKLNRYRLEAGNSSGD